MAADRRYQTHRWRTVRLLVLRRDLYRCRIVAGCTERATLADHVIPATLDMPDAQFFDKGNLRAGCRDHNLARGFAARPSVVAGVDEDVVRGDYS